MDQDFDHLLTRIRSQLETLRASATRSQPPVVGGGMALDGKVKAAMAVDGRLLGLALDASVLQMNERDLAAAIVSAVNQAWAARQGLDESAAATAGIDPAALQRQLTQLQDQGLDTMRRFTDSMQAVLDRADARVPR